MLLLVHRQNNPDYFKVNLSCRNKSKITTDRSSIPAILSATNMTNTEWTNFCDAVDKILNIKLSVIRRARYVIISSDLFLAFIYGGFFFHVLFSFFMIPVFIFFCAYFSYSSKLQECKKHMKEVFIMERGSKRSKIDIIVIDATHKEYIFFAMSQTDQVPSTSTDTDQGMTDFSIPVATQKHESIFDAMSHDIDCQTSGTTRTLQGETKAGSTCRTCLYTAYVTS
jgi:hypothetical protein